MSEIHSTTIIDPSASIADGVSIGAYTVIGPDVEIGADTWIGPHVVINGVTRIGRENRVQQFASIGEAPQCLKYDGEATALEIGNNNTIREFVTINRGTLSGNGVTRVGSNNLLMAYTHIAHDCVVGNNTIFSNGTSLAGHVRIGDYVVLSGFTLVHQFCAIGDYSFAGMGSALHKDVPPYLMVSGNPATPCGLNKVGLKRHGFTAEQIRTLMRVYKILYREGRTLEEAKKRITAMAAGDEAVARFAAFFGESQRSIIR